MNWLYYLLEANLYLAVFYGFYRFFLHKETFYTLNRCYLIIATLVAFMLPVFQVGYLYDLLHNNDTAIVYAPANVPFEDHGINPAESIAIGYLIIAMVFTLKLIASLYRLAILTLKTKKQRNGGIIYLELSGSDTAFSFFNLLFINSSITEKSTILKHEMIHIHQKHSVDVVFFEIVQILCWFNPIAWFIKKDIKLLHEYIADELTTNADLEKHEYAMFLIQNSFGTVPNQLTNRIFNQSILKRRINMLHKKRSPERAKLRLLFALPLVGAMLCASTMAFTKDYAVIDLYPEKYKSFKALNQDTTKKKVSKTHVKQSPQPKVREFEFVPSPPPPVPPKVKQGKAVPPPPPPAPPKVKQGEIAPPPPPVPPTSSSKEVKMRISKDVYISQPGTKAISGPAASGPQNTTKLKSDLYSSSRPAEKLVPAKSTKINLGKNPLFVSNGKAIKVEKNTLFSSRSSINVYPKDNPAAIKIYGEAAKDGVIEVTDVTITKP